LVAAPYLLYLRRSLGHWTLSGKVAHNLTLDLGASVGNAPMAHPGAVRVHTGLNVLVFLKLSLPELLPGVLVLFLVPGVLRRARGEGWVAREGVLLALGAERGGRGKGWCWRWRCRPSARWRSTSSPACSCPRWCSSCRSSRLG